MRRVVRLVAVLAVLVVAGCSSAAPPVAHAPRPTPSPTLHPTPPPASNGSLPPMWTSRADLVGGYGVATPDAWAVAVRGSLTLDSDLKTLGRQSPELEAYFRRSLDSNSEVRFIAADPRSLARGFAANINVIGSDLGPTAKAPTLDELSQAKFARLNGEKSVNRPVNRIRVRLSGLPAWRFEYTITADGQPAAVRSYIAVVEAGGRRRVLEFTMGAPGSETSSSVFDTVAASIVVIRR